MLYLTRQLTERGHKNTCMFKQTPKKDRQRWLGDQGLHMTDRQRVKVKMGLHTDRERFKVLVNKFKVKVSSFTRPSTFHFFGYDSNYCCSLLIRHVSAVQSGCIVVATHANSYEFQIYMIVFEF